MRAIDSPSVSYRTTGGWPSLPTARSVVTNVLAWLQGTVDLPLSARNTSFQSPSKACLACCNGSLYGLWSVGYFVHRRRQRGPGAFQPADALVLLVVLPILPIPIDLAMIVVAPLHNGDLLNMEGVPMRPDYATPLLPIRCGHQPAKGERFTQTSMGALCRMLRRKGNRCLAADFSSA